MPKGFETRHQYIARTGKRISRGAWERMNRAYAVYPQFNDKRQPIVQVVGYDKAGKPLVKQCVTLVLLPQTAKHNRKIFFNRDSAHEPNNERSRYADGKQSAIAR